MNEALISEFARSDASGDAAEASPLRPVMWSELTARLAAMRDFRQSLAVESRSLAANFSSLAAAGSHGSSVFGDFADFQEESAQRVPEVNAAAPDINLNALAGGKGPAPNTSVDPNCVTPGDRELK